MTNSIFPKIKTKAQIVFIILILYFAIHGLFGQSDFELSHKGRVKVSTCNAPKDKPIPNGCFTIYSLDVGNTGAKVQANIDIALHGVIMDKNSPVRLEISTLQIRATNNKTPKPIITHLETPDGIKISMRNLHPNMMTTIKISQFGLQKALILKNLKPKVSGSGNVVEIGPKSSEFWRGIMSMANFFM